MPLKGRGHHGRPRQRWKFKSETDFRDTVSEYGLGSIKDGEFLDQLSDYQLLKKTSIPWR
jgi:hypothetical protein